LASIPGVKAEAGVIRKMAEQSFISAVHFENQSATVDSVKSQISSSKFDIVHFACHGNQEFETPMQSGFHLEDGKLSLGDIIGRREIKPAAEDPPKLAFLSACETGMGKMELAEEAVHLVAGMLAAGFRGVVGTIWSIPDAYAPEIAEEFYREYLGEEGGDAGYALHCATERLRERLGDSDASFLAWVPFVHFGM
jgi:CHAT domain-containing protein